MAEAIIRRHRRTKDRWMHKDKWRITTAQVRAVAAFAMKSVPAFLLAFAEMVGIPSGMHVSLGMALAALGLDVLPVLAGGGTALLWRMASGLPPRWEMLLSLGVVAVCAKLLQGRGTILLAVSTGVAMLPTAVWGCFASTAAEMLQSWAGLAIAAMSAPVFVRAVKTLRGNQHIASVEERVAVGYLTAMCLCGGARMLLLGFNIGGVLSAGVTLVMACVLGPGVGALTGMLSGVVLALQGLPLTLSVALSMGGFLGGGDKVPLPASPELRRICHGRLSAAAALRCNWFGLRCICLGSRDCDRVAAQTIYGANPAVPAAIPAERPISGGCLCGNSTLRVGTNCGRHGAGSAVPEG